MMFKLIVLLVIIVLVSISCYHYGHHYNSHHHYHFQSDLLELFDNGGGDNDSGDRGDSGDSGDDGNGNSSPSGVGPAPICFKKTPRNPTIYNDLKMFQTNMKQLNRRMDTLQKQITALSTMRKEAGQQGTQHSSESDNET